MLYSIVPELLGNKEGSSRNTQTSQGKGIKRDFMSGLLVGRDRTWVIKWEKAKGKSTERQYWNGGILGSGKNLTQGNLPGIYKDGPS